MAHGPRLKDSLEAGAVVQQVRHLLCECSDQSLDAQEAL